MTATSTVHAQARRLDLGQDGTCVPDRLDQPHKIEGVDAQVAGDVIRLLLVTDADDASVPAAMFSAAIPMYADARSVPSV